MKSTTKEAAPQQGKAASQNQNSPQSTVSNDCFKREFSGEFLDSLKARLPEYLAARGVELRKNGTRLVGRCPVHEDSKPSFAVFGARHETAGCFPCGFTGDVFGVSKWLGRASTFPEAVQDVAAVLGVTLPHSTAGTATKPAKAPQRPTKQPAPPFKLSPSDRAKLEAARLAFCDAFHSGDPIIEHIAASLGIDRETLRLASWGSSGLGLGRGAYDKTVWLCYAYPQGLKWRNPDPEAKAKGKARFDWPYGKALAPWRWEWVTGETSTLYLTEGESDCLALIAAGLEADGNAACIASPGTSFPEEWAPLFRGKKVILCFDRDAAGETATAKVAATLRPYAASVSTWKGTARHE